MLDLSGCNIGSIGIKILCDRFLNKENREIVIIKYVDFSYNLLEFSSLMQAFHLCISWHTSQLLIKDSEMLQNYTSSKIYGAIEDAFSSYDKQIGLQLKSLLYGYKISVSLMLFKTKSIQSVYMLNCTWASVIHEVETLTPLTILSEVHLINTPMPKQIMKKLCTGILNAGVLNAKLFIYNPELSDHEADEICSSTLSSGKTEYAEVILIISNTKIQGIINTFNINQALTKLEIANLAVNINQKSFDDMVTLPWKGNLSHDIENSDYINKMFIELLHKIVCNKWNWNLKIVLTNIDTVIAYKANFKYLSEKTRMHRLLKNIYLSDCSITYSEYQILFGTKILSTNLCIINACVDYNCLKMINHSLSFKEVFVHTLCDINIEETSSHFRENCLAVLVTKNKMLGCNPTLKQMALAFRIEPSIDAIKLLHYRGNVDLFDQIIKSLTMTYYNWTELDFMNCTLDKVEYKILQKHLMKISEEDLSKKKILTVSSKQLTKSLVPKFIETILVWKVQHITFYEIDHSIYEDFVIQFAITLSTVLEKVFLSVTYNSNNDLYFCNFTWSQITTLLESSSCSGLFIISCCLPKDLDISELNHLSKLHMINSTLHEDAIFSVFETCVESDLEISVHNSFMHIDDIALYDFITSKKLFHQSGLKFVAVFKNFMCGYSLTKFQLNLLLSQNLSKLESTIVTLVNGTKQMHEKELFVLQSKKLIALHSIGNSSDTAFVTKLLAVSQRISTLRSFGINKYIISSKSAIDIAATLCNNKELEHLYLNSKLQNADILNIMETLLEKLTNLQVFEISNICITDQVTKYLTAMISHNMKLQDFKIANDSLCVPNILKILKALQCTPSMKQIILMGHKTKVTSVTATVMFNGIEMQYQDDNNMKTMCMKLIAKRLHIGNNDAAKNATKDMSSAFYCTTQLQEIDKNIFRPIIKVLENSFALNALCIRNESITDKEVDDIAAAVSNNTQLQEIDISKINLRSTGAIKIANVLKSISTLTKLHINGNHITNEAVDDIVNAISCNYRLQKLDISKNQFQTVGIINIVKCLQNISTLKKLYMSNNNITDEAADDIASAINSNSQLQEFDVKLQSTGVIKIAKALQSISTLKKFNISNNDITDKVADDIASAINSNSQLQEFDVSKNKLQSTGVIKIAKALQSISTLKKFNLSNNDITDKVAADLASVLSLNGKLQEFNISKTEMQTKGITTIVKALQSITTLTKLNICDTSITDEGANKIAALLYQSTQLQEFGIGLGQFTQNDIVCITRILCRTANLKVLKLKGNGFLITEHLSEVVHQ